MRRRDFIKVVAGSAAAWPFTARAQQGERVRRIGVIHSGAADDPNIKARNTAFLKRSNNWAGLMAATFGSTYVGPRLMPNSRAGRHSSHRQFDCGTVAAIEPVHTHRIYDRS